MSTCCSSPRATHIRHTQGDWRGLGNRSEPGVLLANAVRSTSSPPPRRSGSPQGRQRFGRWAGEGDYRLGRLGPEDAWEFGVMKAQMQYGATNTTTLEKLANDNPNVTFIHSWPGWVNTGNVRRSSDPNSIMAWFVWLILEPIIGLFGFIDEESGQRHLFQSTSAAFGGRGVLWKGKPGINSLEKQADGLFLVNYKCDCTPNAKVTSLLREKAHGKVGDDTQEVSSTVFVDGGLSFVILQC